MRERIFIGTFKSYSQFDIRTSPDNENFRLDRICPTHLATILRMDIKIGSDNGGQSLKIKVTLGPGLELQAGQMTPAQRRALADVYGRMSRQYANWEHQLRVTATIIEAHSAPRPRRKPGQFPRAKLVLN
jgi:hypothetical protein